MNEFFYLKKKCFDLYLEYLDIYEIDLEFTFRIRKPLMHLTHTYKFRKDIDVLFSL